jgi:hypothetical protein
MARHLTDQPRTGRHRRPAAIALHAEWQPARVPAVALLTLLFATAIWMLHI